MTDWQTIIAVLIVIAGLTGRQWNIVSIVALNFMATMLLAANPVNVAIGDAIAASLLLFMGRRGQVVAAIYAVMIPIYPAMSAAGFPNYTTYAIIDVLAIGQILIAGRWDVGIGRALWVIGGRYPAVRRVVASWPGLARRSGMDKAEGGQS